jgi:hypothetical protein
MNLSGIPRIPRNRFTHSNAVCNNGVFLLEVKDEPPFSVPVEGWKFAGYGKAPWPKNGSDFAVMLEKVAPAAKYGGHRGEDLPEGTRLWHHYDEAHWNYTKNGILK